jgi:hypothetical protein
VGARLVAQPGERVEGRHLMQGRPACFQLAKFRLTSVAPRRDHAGKQRTHLVRDWDAHLKKEAKTGDCR